MTLCEQICDRNHKSIQAIILTDEEQDAAIFEGKRKKLFKENNAEYWHNKEFGDNVKTKQISI